MVASHTAAPIGAAKWLVRATPTPQTLPLGKGQGLLMSPTQGQGRLPKGRLILLGQPSHQPFRRTHRHGCMAGYLCPMPLASFLCDSASRYYSLMSFRYNTLKNKEVVPSMLSDGTTSCYWCLQPLCHTGRGNSFCPTGTIRSGNTSSRAGRCAPGRWRCRHVVCGR